MENYLDINCSHYEGIISKFDPKAIEIMTKYKIDDERFYHLYAKNHGEISDVERDCLMHIARAVWSEAFDKPHSISNPSVEHLKEAKKIYELINERNKTNSSPGNVIDDPFVEERLNLLNSLVEEWSKAKE